ncbi:unnamed protein product [Parnassius mnemosyne]|uniref:Ig-like domain-containing protein n=1 Tax=Parnassius mnemosyne TaxID=213953 RepID=A0AAV1L1Z0_9NEOP
MDTRDLLCSSWLIIIFLNQSGCDWLNCANIVECHCKWASGKKTASCISAALTHLPRLAPDIQVLDLHGNPLVELNKDAFANIYLLNLQRLNLSSTKLQKIHKDAFRELRILIELDLSQNELIHLSPDTFKGNDRLRLLVLNDNHFNEFVAQQFPPLQHLKRLEISRCQLRKIHPFAFTNLRALETIHIQQNLLSYIHPNTFNLPLLKTLTLSDNPWYCDCRLRYFHEWFINANFGNEEVLCAGPNIHAQSSWRDIKGQEMNCPPTVVSSPSVLRTVVGADITFGCFVNGDPKPVVSWLFHHKEIQNFTSDKNKICIKKYEINNLDEYNNDIINKSSQWVNVTISNVTDTFSGEWKCHAKSSVGESSAYVTLYLPKARTATARAAPEYSFFILVIGSMLAMTGLGLIATCACWKFRRQRLPPSRSFTDQEKKLLDSSLAASCDRQSVDLESSYAFEMLDRSLSMDSEGSQRYLETVPTTLEAPEMFPPPPSEFALPAPYANIFISVQLSDTQEEYPDFLGGGATLPRRSKTCFLESAYDNMGPRVTAAGNSNWSLPEDNASNNKDSEKNIITSFSTISTELTAL